MSEELVAVPVLRRVYQALRLTPDVLSEEELDRGLAQLGARLARLAVEALEAEALGRSLADAAGDELAFPAMHRLHLGLRDILTMSLPPELASWARRALAAPESPLTDALQRSLARVAASPQAPAGTRALARLLLFEAVRTSLIIAEHLSGSSIAAVGAGGADVDAIAEREVEAWMVLAAEADPEVRPLEVLTAAALLQLERHVEELRETLYRLDDDMATAVRVRAQLELKLRDMDAADAVLARNAFASALEEQRLEVEHLRAEHPLVLGDRRRDAIDQRVSRLRRRLIQGEWPQRRSPALIDLIAETDAAEPGE